MISTLSCAGEGGVYDEVLVSRAQRPDEEKGC